MTHSARKGPTKGVPTKGHLKPDLIDAYKALGTYSAACEKVGISFQTMNEWRKADPEFKAALDQADEQFGERIERVALEEAVLGKMVPVYFEGRKVDEYRERDSKVLLEILKVRNLKYRTANRIQNFNLKVLAIIDSLTSGFADMLTERIRPTCPHCRKALDTRADVLAGLQDLAQRFASTEMVDATMEATHGTNDLTEKR